MNEFKPVYPFPPTTPLTQTQQIASIQFLIALHNEGNIEQKIQSMIDIFKGFLKQPLLLALYPNFRNVAEMKLYEIAEAIESYTIPYSLKLKYYKVGLGISELLDILPNHPKYVPEPKRGVKGGAGAHPSKIEV